MKENNMNQKMQDADSDSVNTHEESMQIKPMISIEDKPKSVGPVIGIAIIVVIIIFGGLYFWGAKINKRIEKNVLLTAEVIENKEVSTFEQQKTLSPSDEIIDIEKDLDATGLDNLDQELEQIDQELIL